MVRRAAYIDILCIVPYAARLTDVEFNLMAINGRERDTGEYDGEMKVPAGSQERETSTVGEKERGATRQKRERTTLLQTSLMRLGAAWPRDSRMMISFHFVFIKAKIRGVITPYFAGNER